MKFPFFLCVAEKRSFHDDMKCYLLWGEEKDDVDDDAFVDPAELKLDFNFE